MPSPAAVASGDVVVIGGLVGIAAGSAASGADLDLVTEGVFTLSKVSALAIAIGDSLYYDSATKLVNKTAAGNTLIGKAVTAAANPSASVNVKVG